MQSRNPSGSRVRGTGTPFLSKFPRRLIVPRLRLREEVDVLKHLAQRSSTFRSPAGHPNVLGYIDSWEEDEALFIQTELCESGNLAHFLWQYGRVFPRLDEARVWKIIVDLSNVSHVAYRGTYPH